LIIIVLEAALPGDLHFGGLLRLLAALQELSDSFQDHGGPFLVSDIFWFCFGLLEALTGPLHRPLSHSLFRPLPGFLVDGSGGILFVGFRKGDGHPDSIPFLLKSHGVLLVMLCYLLIYISISMPNKK
jgi:hypothetical protein